MKKDSIIDFTSDEIRSIFAGFGEGNYRAEQVLREIFMQRRENFSDMTTLPVNLRNELNVKYIIQSIENYQVSKSKDGSQKYLFNLSDGASIETVLMPWLDDDTGESIRNTLCVSSQAGCAVGCIFCATGSLGIKRNLKPSEIAGQVLFSEKLSGARITNIVLMGMGEPMLNLENVLKAVDLMTDEKFSIISRNKIVLSTVGIISGINKLSEIDKPLKLALSLHSTDDNIRQTLIPSAKANPMKELLDSVENYYKKTGFPVTYEYILFDGVNDGDSDAKRLVKFARRVPSKVNIIPFNDISFVQNRQKEIILKPSPPERIERFMEILKESGIIARKRKPFGRDIEAACGQLALTRITGYQL
ncbi:MAG: rRNA (adenine2503-C2)-methyltransferase [Bacteroidota bacterium]|nr:rRNA (adenine2503-C2)-methyltransferase [Bacteroidota bacterium]